MKKKFIIAGLTCAFLLISGICYSCAYRDKKESVFVSSLSEKSAEEMGSERKTTEGNDPAAGTLRENETSEEEVEATTEADIYIHVCGAVKMPGVYQVKSGARLFDVIELSGGLCKDAAADYINQAQEVSDGQRIYIPTKEEVKELSAGEYIEGAQSSTESDDNTPALVNINTASTEELMSLPGIGQAKADSIIDYRTTNGNFKSIEELMNIPGIKEGLYNKISSYIKVN